MFTPYDFQIAAINSILTYFQEGNKGNPLVVAPTGSGKSVIIACFCRLVLDKWLGQKILVVSHVKEILAQNYSAIKKQAKNNDIGLYSAGLKEKRIRSITVAGIHSIYNKPELFDDFNIIIVDECHAIPTGKNGMYNKFFNAVKKPIIGFTATPFRLGTGYLHMGKNRLFDDIVYSIPIRKLQKEGYLCKLVSKGTKRKMNATGIKKQAGDYVLKELSMAFDREAITKDIIFELVRMKEKRKKWLAFAIDIKHAENITSELKEKGINCACVHSKMTGSRDEIISDFKAGKYQCLVSVAVLTTGFDVPDIDLIALLRPTSSPNLHVQIIGRGLRVSEGKKDCIVLDFAGNLMRNGPIDAPIIKLKGKGGGEPIMKECPNCWEIVHAAVRVCPACAAEFKFKHHLSAQAKEREIVTKDHWHEIANITYFRHVGAKGIPMLKVSYFCGLRRFSEFICLEHPGYARYKAVHWWKTRSKTPAPATAMLACEQSDTLNKPTKILVNEGGKYDSIKDWIF